MILDEALDRLGRLYNVVLRIEQDPQSGGKKWICKFAQPTKVNNQMAGEFIFWNNRPAILGWPMDIIMIDGKTFKSKDLAERITDPSGTKVILDTSTDTPYGKIYPWTSTYAGGNRPEAFV